ncbi:HlyC/CorC family transporter [candidate division TA06 bacterium]|uniref:HlyC/CorC family transporter n=1 Tax=candidate division TA06 bacterium TaxID=2250710 RepID=A0A933IAS5_UNCT6|nr:HlyC/CorC family transporter [candidate division TA06 bacterium]
MEISIWSELLLIAALIFFNGLLSASEIALITVRKSSLKELSHRGDQRAKSALRLLEDPSRLFATIQMGVTFLGFLASAVAAVSSYKLVSQTLEDIPLGIISQNSHPIALALVTAVVSFFTIILGELTPKNIALKHSQFITLLVARPLEFMAVAARPAIWLLTRATDLTLSIFGIKKAQLSSKITEDEIKALLSAGHEQGVLDRSETEMIHGIFELGDKTAREIMVPRIDMVAAPFGLPIFKAVKLMEKAGHTRIPVYRQTIDNIVGIAYATDINKALRSGVKNQPVDELARPAHFVPESKKLDGLLQEFQSWKTHLAIVVDEYGGTAGMVTLEDVLEEIVGEVRDEFDTEEPLFRKIDERTYRIDARIDIEQLNEALGSDFPTEGFETLGGFIYDIAGKVPSSGEKLKWPQSQPAWEFTVEAVRQRRIMAVRARRLLKLPSKPGLQDGSVQTAATE